MNKHIGMLAVLHYLTFIAAVLATPGLKVANAQGNQSAGIEPD